MLKFFFLIYTLPDPAPYETVLRSRTRPLVAEAELGVPHVIEDHGGSWDASAMISYVTASTLAYPGVVWAGAVEPPGVAGNLDERVQAMGLSEDGTMVYDTTLLDHGMLVSGYELGLPYASEGSFDAPAPRTGYVAVLSRQAGGVFVIGGRDPVTNEELGDVHLWRPGIGWSTVVQGSGFQNAEAATFAPADGKLWIVEKKTSTYNLLRISPWTGEIERVGAWAQNGIWDQHFLSVDRDGHALLFASSRNTNASKFARLRVGAEGAYAAQIDADSVPYSTSAPIVDKDEYGAIVRDQSGAVTSVFRRANLLGATGTFALDEFF